MKDLKESLRNKLLSEGLKIGAKTKVKTYNFHPKTKDELKELIVKLIKERGKEADLNDIDTSEITDMKDLFWGVSFNGDISDWNVSNVTDMSHVFYNNSKFTGENSDISKWDVSNVIKMGCMFYGSAFDGDISNWDVRKVKDMLYMFRYSEFNGDISNWDVRNVKVMDHMFDGSPLAKNPPKWFKKYVLEKIK